MGKKIIYEENPWDDLKDQAVENFEQVHDLLPPASELRNAKIVVDGNEIILLRLSPSDIESLKNIAKKDGISSVDLATSIVHEFIANLTNQ